MTAAAYDALKNRIIAIGEFYAVRPCTHAFNSDDDHDALMRQAQEAVRLLGMGRVCERCRGSNGVPRGVSGCPDCNETGWQNDSSTPAIDRLAIANVLGPRNFYEGAYAFPMVAIECASCLGEGETIYPAWSERDGLRCTACHGTGKTYVRRHKWQQPRNLSPGGLCPCFHEMTPVYPPGEGAAIWRAVTGGWVRRNCRWCKGTSTIAHGPGVRGLRESPALNDNADAMDHAIRENPDRFGLRLETDYPCGNNPDPDDDETWNRLWDERFHIRGDQTDADYDFEEAHGAILRAAPREPAHQESFA